MTGRELIIYILQNGLEDEEVIHEGHLIGFMTLEEAAAYFGQGTQTIRTWTVLGMIDYVLMDGNIYIPKNATPKNK